MCFFLMWILFFLITGCGHHFNSNRSPLRKTTHRLPTIIVSDPYAPHPYARTSSHYKEYPIFTVFDYSFFIKHLIPAAGIATLDGTAMVKKDEIDAIIQEIMAALLRKETPLPHCTIIRDANFNHQSNCGLLIFKLNKYPLIVKLFRETAESFVHPFSKGFEPTTFFFMSGGANRHIAGLSRIPNREYLIAMLTNNPIWHGHVRIPRKWYWVPQPPEWLSIDGYAFEAVEHVYTKIPAIYAVIADYIEPETQCFIDLEEQKKLIMDLSTHCLLHLDPHMKNFVITQETPSAAPLITILDTEDHQCMTGLTEPITCTNHLEWYALLTGKFIKNALFNVKTSC